MLSTTSLCILFLFISGFSADYCNFDVKLHQELLNEGFHRNLTYKLTFQDSHFYKECYVGLDQRLPAGVYAAPDELGDLMRFNKLTTIPKNGVNIELPAEQSQPTSVFIISNLAREVNLWLPVHARYHRATKGGGFYSNEIGQARVFIRCPHQLDCEPPMTQISFLCSGVGKEMCVWNEITVTTATNQPVQFSVPVGDVEHIDMVAPVTLAAVLILSLYLLITLHEHKMASLKRMKQQKMGRRN